MSSSFQETTLLDLLLRSLDDALVQYKKKTGNDLRSHWLADQLNSCKSVDAVLYILREQAKPYEKSSNIDLMMWIGPLVDILDDTFSNPLNVGDNRVSLVLITNTFHKVSFDVDFKAFPPEKAIVIGIGILLHVCVLAIPFVDTPF